MLKCVIVRKSLGLMAMLMVFLSPYPASAAGFDGQLSIDEQTLYLNGEGPRKKAFLTVYDMALYLTEKGSDAEAIIKADHPMAIRLIIRSRFATAERISEAFREGLEKSTGGDSHAIDSQIETFLSVFDNGVVKEDAFNFVYLPNTGLKIYKNGDVTTQIKGIEFKQALYGIWLSDDPVVAKLKSQLLGR